MERESYPYTQIRSEQYFFVSEGKSRIAKSVTFDQVADKTVNLCFGDLLSDDRTDDIANSNNGDIVKVVATVLHILRQFFIQHPEMRVYIEGSTRLRMLLYNRVLKNYYNTLSKEFSITCYTNNKDDIRTLEYDPEVESQYLAFMITNKS